MKKVVHSRLSDEWRTPYLILDYLAKNGYQFTYDLAANNENSIAPVYCDDFKPGPIWKKISVADFGFIDSIDGLCFCNPPYSKGSYFVKTIYERKCPTIMLLPARTDTRWFHDYIYNKPDVRIEFWKGRLKFSGAKWNAPFPSMLVYMNLKGD